MRNRSLWLSAMGSLAIVSLPTFAWANHAVGSAPWKEGASVEAGLSLSSVYSEELVFDDSIAPGYKLSELDWDADLLLMGASGSFRQQRWVASAGAWTSLDTLDGSMVDYDWVYPDIPDWSDRSIGEADLDMTSFDVNAGFTVLQSDSMPIDLVLGYREDDLSWADFGGTYIYSAEGFRDDAGMFNEETGITYDQDIQIPYVGVHVHTRLHDALTLSGYFLYSALGEITAKDHHILRDTRFVDTFSDVEYIGAGAHATWQFNARFHAGLAIDYQNIPEVDGDGRVVDEVEDQTYGAGVLLETTSASVSLGCSF